MLVGTSIILYNKYSTIETDKATVEALLTKHDSIQKQWRNRTLIYPDSTYNLKTKVDIHEQLEESEKDFTLISYFDADCSDCVLELNKWTNFFSTYKEAKEKIEIIFIASSSNIELFKYQIYDNAKFQHNIFYDQNNEFVNLNKLLEPKTYRTILLKNGKIIYLGSPIIDDLFEEEFKTILNM
jgi:hypothetical protein